MFEPAMPFPVKRRGVFSFFVVLLCEPLPVSVGAIAAEWRAQLRRLKKSTFPNEPSITPAQACRHSGNINRHAMPVPT